jgi:hypothetical protein
VQPICNHLSTYVWRRADCAESLEQGNGRLVGDRQGWREAGGGAMEELDHLMHCDLAEAASIILACAGRYEAGTWRRRHLLHVAEQVLDAAQPGPMLVLEARS